MRSEATAAAEHKGSVHRSYFSSKSVQSQVRVCVLHHLLQVVQLHV